MQKVKYLTDILLIIQSDRRDFTNVKKYITMKEFSMDWL